MSTIVKAADAAQFLSLVPRLLGYTPSRSIVLIPMAEGRSIGAMRVDLPPGDDPGTVDRVASTVVGMVCRIPRAEGFIAVMYTDAAVRDGAGTGGVAGGGGDAGGAGAGGAGAGGADAGVVAGGTDAGGALPHARMAAALGRCAAASGLYLADALTVAADAWGSHLDPAVPAGGRPLTELITAGGPERSPGGDQASGAGLPPHSAAERRQVGAATKSLRASLELLCGVPAGGSGGSGGLAGSRIDPAALAAACELDDLPKLYERALQWDPAALPPIRAAMLGWCLGRPALRDVALVQWVGDIVRGEDALEAQQRWEDGAEYPADLASVMWGEGPRPDPDRLERAVELVRHVAALTPRRQRAGALATCGWLSWALGRSTHAERYAEMAREIDADHGLAEIVRSFVRAGHLPDWAFRPTPAAPSALVPSVSTSAFK